MSNNIEWVDARHEVPNLAYDDFTNPFGNGVSAGRTGIAFGNVCVEGTPEQLRTFFQRCLDVVPKEGCDA